MKKFLKGIKVGFLYLLGSAVIYNGFLFIMFGLAALYQQLFK